MIMLMLHKPWLYTAVSIQEVLAAAGPLLVAAAGKGPGRLVRNMFQ
jgi:hypothetical protein